MAGSGLQRLVPRVLTINDAASNDYGEWASIAIGGDGLPLISYWDKQNNNLKVAHCAKVDCSVLSPSAPTVVDGAGSNVGQYSSITVGTDGFGLISYYDASNKDLKVAHCTNADCSAFTTATIDSSSADVGQYTSITIGADGFGLIAYYDVANTALKVAHCSNTACSAVSNTTTVDNAAAVGKWASIIIGRDDLGIVAYHDETGGDLKTAHCDNTNCTTATVTAHTSGSNIGQYASITIVSDGLPLISHYDATNLKLRATHCNEVACTTPNSGQWMDPSVDDNGLWTAITTVHDGYGFIAYHDDTDGDLWLGHCDNVSCSTQYGLFRVAGDTGGDVGENNAMAIGADNNPIIAYRDVTNKVLKVLHSGNVLGTPFNRR